MNIYKLFQTPKESWKTILNKRDFKEFSIFMHSSYTEFYNDFPQRADIIKKLEPFLSGQYNFVYIGWKDETFYITLDESSFLDFPAKVIGFTPFEECKEQEGNQDIHYGKTEKKDIKLEETKEKPAEEEIDPEIIIEGLKRKNIELTQMFDRLKMELGNCRRELNAYDGELKKKDMMINLLKIDNNFLHRQLNFTNKIADKALMQFGFSFDVPQVQKGENEK